MLPTRPQRPTEILQATVESILHRSEDGRFSVVRATKEPDSKGAVLVGDLGASPVGETLRVRGYWERHVQYGDRFRVESFAPVTPQTKQGIARYLGSGLVPGIGTSLAQRLVERFGERTLDIITSQSGRLQEVDGIGPQRAKSIAEAVRARRQDAELLSHLHALGIGPRLAQRILRRYGDRTLELLRQDPYRLAEELAGVGFRTADGIGTATGFAPDDPRRAAGAALHLVGRAADEGHVFLPVHDLQHEAANLGIPDARTQESLEALVSRGQIVVDEDRVYLADLHRAERGVAEAVAGLARQRSPRLDTTRALEAIRGESLNAEQREAVRASLVQGLLVLTGGPGTGKTTTVSALVAAHATLGRRVALCAPTGRAAKRLSDATQHEAKTLHRLLEFNPATHRFGRDKANPLEADLVLVDEASMLHLRLAEALFDALPPCAQLVLVGDVDQLPPVGAGQVLREIIASQRIPIVRLTEIFRQAQKSAIVRGAHAILRGESPEATLGGTRGEGDLFIVRAKRPEAVQARLLETLTRIPAAYGIDARDGVQVLVPMRRGALGTEHLNLLLQQHFQPGRPIGPDRGLRPGDKVMQLRNDYDREVFNGDVGIVIRVESGVVFVDMGGREVAYDGEALDALTLAYATTIHKVQGSEFPAVVIVLHSAHHVLLSRALIYTAVTRAQRLVVIIGDASALQRAVGHALVHTTHCRLAERLREALDPPAMV